MARFKPGWMKRGRRFIRWKRRWRHARDALPANVRVVRDWVVDWITPQWLVAVSALFLIVAFIVIATKLTSMKPRQEQQLEQWRELDLVEPDLPCPHHPDGTKKRQP